MSVNPKCDLCDKEIPHADDILIVRVEHKAWWTFFSDFAQVKGNMSKLRMGDSEDTIMTSWCCRNRVLEAIGRLDGSRQIESEVRHNTEK